MQCWDNSYNNCKEETKQTQSEKIHGMGEARQSSSYLESPAKAQMFSVRLPSVSTRPEGPLDPRGHASHAAGTVEGAYRSEVLPPILSPSHNHWSPHQAILLVQPPPKSTHPTPKDASTQAHLSPYHQRIRHPCSSGIQAQPVSGQYLRYHHHFAEADYWTLVPDALEWGAQRPGLGA